MSGGIGRFVDLLRRFPYRLRLDRTHLQDDGRKLSGSAITAGMLGLIVRTDVVRYQDALALIIVGMVLWILASVEPVSSNSERRKYGA